jgi:hypothetical protein
MSSPIPSSKNSASKSSTSLAQLSIFHSAVPLRSAFPSAMLTLENFQMACSHQSGRRQAASELREAKKRLIATHPKLEIAATHTKHKTSHFLIATKNRFRQLALSRTGCDSRLAFVPSGVWNHRATSKNYISRLAIQRHSPCVTLVLDGRLSLGADAESRSVLLCVES